MREEARDGMWRIVEVWEVGCGRRGVSSLAAGEEACSWPAGGEEGLIGCSIVFWFDLWRFLVVFDVEVLCEYIVCRVGVRVRVRGMGEVNR
jgi:hypothetical protein